MIAGRLDLLAEPGVTTVRCTCGRPAGTRLVWAANLLTHIRHRPLVGPGLPVCGPCAPYYRHMWAHDAVVYTTEVTR